MTDARSCTPSAVEVGATAAEPAEAIDRVGAILDGRGPRRRQAYVDRDARPRGDRLDVPRQRDRPPARHERCAGRDPADRPRRGPVPGRRALGRRARPARDRPRRDLGRAHRDPVAPRPGSSTTRSCASGSGGRPTRRDPRGADLAAARPRRTTTAARATRRTAVRRNVADHESVRPPRPPGGAGRRQAPAASTRTSRSRSNGRRADARSITARPRPRRGRRRRAHDHGRRGADAKRRARRRPRRSCTSGSDT